MGLAVQFSTIGELFENLVNKYEMESRPVMMVKGEKGYSNISFTEFRRAVDETARGFLAIGVVRNETFGIIAENRPEWAITDMACIRIGAVSVPIYPTLTPAQIAYILNDAQAKYVVVSNQFQLNKILKVRKDLPLLQKIIVMTPKGVEENDEITSLASLRQKGVARNDLAELAAGLWKETTPEDLLTLIYTSGTTGNPKGVMLTHRNLVSNIMASVPCLPISESDTLLSYLPLSHCFERMAGYYTALACGGTIAYAESIESVRENILEVQPTIITTVPRLFEKIHSRILKQVESSPLFRQKIFHWAMQTGYSYVNARRLGKLSASLKVQNALADKLVFQKIRARTGGRLRFFVSGGAALAPELGRFFEAIGIMIIEGYGMTEASPVISVNRLDDYKFGSVGKAVGGVEIKIAPDGEILARGPNVMKGYWNDPAATREMIDQAGWLHTGDIGEFDRNGFLAITDRKKHIFVNSGGKNIAPHHVESLFIQSPYIDQFVLIGEKKMFCSALIVPDFEAIREFARSHNIPFETNADLVRNEQIRKLFENDISSMQKDLASYERVRKFTLLPNPFSIDSGELTPTLKVKRNIVEERYRDLIQKMYEGLT